MVLDGKTSQEYPVNAGLPLGSIVGPTLFLICINYLPHVIWMRMILLSTINVIRHDLWQFLDLASELKYDLYSFMAWRWLVLFNATKTQLVSFDWSYNPGTIDVKDLLLRKNHLLKRRDWPYFLNWIGAITLSLPLIQPPRKMEP